MAEPLTRLRGSHLGFIKYSGTTLFLIRFLSRSWCKRKRNLQLASVKSTFEVCSAASENMFRKYVLNRLYFSLREMFPCAVPSERWLFNFSSFKCSFQGNGDVWNHRLGRNASQRSSVWNDMVKKGLTYFMFRMGTCFRLCLMPPYKLEENGVVEVHGNELQKPGG